jgi:hypothetical protein
MGHPTWYEIESLTSNKVRVYMDIYPVEVDMWKLLVSAISVIAVILTITLKREHTLSKVALIILLSISIYSTHDYEKISERVIRKILF